MSRRHDRHRPGRRHNGRDRSRIPDGPRGRPAPRPPSPPSPPETSLPSLRTSPTDKAPALPSAVLAAGRTLYCYVAPTKERLRAFTDLMPRQAEAMICPCPCDGCDHWLLFCTAQLCAGPPSCPVDHARAAREYADDIDVALADGRRPSQTLNTTGWNALVPGC